MATPEVTAPIVADHAQFYVHDSSVNPFEPFPTITDRESRLGWTRNDNSIWYSTAGQLWSYRLDIFVAAHPPLPGDSERMLAHNLDLPTGNLVVHEQPGCSIFLRPGSYSIYLRAYNLGCETDEELPDPEFLAREDLERYELFIVPGVTQNEGVISGKEFLS
jgi:hypothetical protein